MVIPVLAILGFAILVMVGVGKLYFRLHPGWDHANRKYGAFLSALVAIGITYLVAIPMKTVVVIEDCQPISMTPSHKRVYCFGNPTIRTANTEVNTKDYELKNGKTYVINLSSIRLRYYPVRYVSNGGIAGSSEKEEFESHPSTTYIDPLDCVMIPKEPNIWFCDPPEEFDTNPSRYERIWNFFLGGEEVMWCLAQ